MTLEEFNDAETNAWVDKDKLEQINDPMAKHFAQKTRIAYQAGKGNNHLVPLLIPDDTYAGLVKLANAEIRAIAGIPTTTSLPQQKTQTAIVAVGTASTMWGKRLV